MTSLPVKFDGDNLGALVSLADRLQKAEGMVPKHMIGQPGKILAAILAGQELGVGPMASLRSFHVVEGKPVADYGFWVARLKAAGYRMEWLHKTAEKVTLRLTAPDGMSHTETWDKDRAVRAGLWNGKDNWKKYPETMLSARCVTSAGRAFAAEVMFGCYESDEAEEIRTVESKDVTPTTTVEHVKNVAEAVGAEALSDDEAQRLQRARMLADALKASGCSRDDVDAAMRETLGIEPTRISALSHDQMTDLEGWLTDRIAKKQEQEA